MPKKLLIPIDFKVESLNTLKYALKGIDEEVEVVLMYSEYLSDSISELLLYSPDEQRNSLKSGDFREALCILKNRYESMLVKVDIELFHGYNTNALKNFIEGHNIDSMYIPKNYKLQPPKNGFDPIPLIVKSKLAYEEVEWQQYADSSSELSLLFI